MIRTRKKYGIWAMAATFGLLSALNIGSLHAADVKWHPGVQLRGLGAPKTETVSEGKHRLTSNGYAVRGFVLLGWSDQVKPVVRTQAAESSVQPLYRVGEFLDVQGDRTLYAVWAVDANNNGSPDYLDFGKELRYDEAYIEKLIAEWERKKREAEGGAALRSAPVSLPTWNIKDDILAYKEKVYFVGCKYNTDTLKKHKSRDPLIQFDVDLSFGKGNLDSIKARRDLELVFEYGGVLEDSCLIGGKDQKPLKRILIPAGKSIADTLWFNGDPLTFTRIKGDGEAVLKLYFVRKNTGKGPDTLANDTSDWNVLNSLNKWKKPAADMPILCYPHPFYNPETGAPSDTLTIRFQIYNQPKFAATSIRSDILYGDTTRLNYAHLSGTPTKYMARSLEGGWNWHPADSPLSDVEKDLLQDDSTRVCLRQLDNAVGWIAFQKDGLLDPEIFSYDHNVANNNSLVNKFQQEVVRPQFYIDYYNKLSSNLQDTIRNIFNAMPPPATWDNSSIKDRGLGIYECLQEMEVSSTTWSSPFSPTQTEFLSLVSSDWNDIYPGKAKSEIEAITKRDWNTVWGKMIAAGLPTPDWCREGTSCFYVHRTPAPVIERRVFIPRVEGVTVLSPEVGYNSVPSQHDFPFRVKYAGKPMKVTVKSLLNGRIVRELVGTPNAVGEYEYVIRRVMQDLTLEFTSPDANALVDQASVWTYGGAVRIRAPKETTVRIYSASGLLVKQLAVQGDKTVSLSAGLYMVVLSDGTTHKVIVQ